jgi:hypothetical protein
VSGGTSSRVGDQAIAEMTRHEARQWLSRSKPWRDLNPELARELGIDEVA